MNVLYILGAIGGILAGIDVISGWVVILGHKYMKYCKMRSYYMRHHGDSDKPPMGFRTEKEQAEIEDRLRAMRES